MKFSLDFLLKSTGGRLLGGRMPLGASGISTDSRTIRKNQLFVALKGENFDGHDYVPDVLSKGCAGAVVEKYPREIAKYGCGALIKVASTQAALLDMAGRWRNSFAGLKVAAVTGSNGKTTTKNMTRSILSVSNETLATSGNFNNQIGLPLTLLKLEKSHAACVVEMGMNSFGEIRTLAECASPQVGAITNIGNAHLEKMGTLEGVAKAKGELVENFGPENTFCVNADDPRVVKIAEGADCGKIAYGIRNPDAFIRADDIRREGLESVEFTMRIGERSARTRIRGMGVHNVMNALSAAALAHSLGCGMNEILAGLEKYAPAAMRLEVIRTRFGFRIINDTYNANPDSVRAALEELAGQKTKGARTVAVLGDMLELGEKSAGEHEKIGERVSALGIDMVVALGEFSESVLSGAGGATRRRAAGSHAEAADILAEFCGPDDLVLLKGSRGMRMEEIIKELYER